MTKITHFLTGLWLTLKRTKNYPKPDCIMLSSDEIQEFVRAVELEKKKVLTMGFGGLSK